MNNSSQKKRKSPVRIISIIILIFTGLCLLTSGISFLTNQFLPKVSSTPNELTEEDLARVDESINLMSALGSHAWPGFNGKIPQILWNDSNAFLLNATEQLSGWDILEGKTANNLPVYVQNKEIDYQAFTEKLANGHYAGSMATKNATNIGFINLFKENLPPVISQIFPYRTLLLSSDQYITALVHESFHAYQAETYPNHFKDSEKAYLSTQAYEEIFPKMSEDWQNEVQILLDAVQETDPTKQIALVKDFLDTREARREKAGLSQKLVFYEKRFEWLEGSAKYIELEIWKIAADSPDYQPLGVISIDKDFDNYQTFDKRWKNEQSNAKNAAKNGGDSLFYYTGMLQGQILDNLMPDWKIRIGEPGIGYEDLLQEVVN